MIFKSDRRTLKNAIDSVSKAIPPKAAIDSLKFIRCETKNGTLLLTGYDLATGIITSIDIEVPMGEESCASFLCDGKKLSEILGKQTAAEVEIEISGTLDAMTIKSGKSKCKLAILPDENYPSIPSFADDTEPITLSSDILSDMIRQTIFAVAVTENKPVLTGECFDISDGNLEIAAIDGYRLAVRTEKIGVERKEHFVVPAKALNDLCKLMSKDKDIKIYPSKKNVIFDMGETKMFCRLLEGEFHNYRGSIPLSSSTEVYVNTRPFIEALERFTTLIDIKNKAPLCCEFSSGSIELSLRSSLGEMQETIDENIDFSGERVKIGFNCHFLLDALKGCESDRVKLRLNGGLSPMKIIPVDGDSYVYLVLPVRLKN